MYIRCCIFLLWSSVAEESESDDSNGTSQHEKSNNVTFVPTAERILIIATYAFLIIWGIWTNCTTCYIAINEQSRRRNVRNRKLHCQTPVNNYYVMILAFSDLITCLICMPIALMICLKMQWIGKPFVCGFLSFVQNTLIAVSSTTVATIAFERYVAIGGSAIRNSRRRYEIVIKLLMIWLFSLCVASPLLLSNDLDAIWNRVYTLTLLCVQFLIPAIVLTISHLMIWRHINVDTTCYQRERRSRNGKVTRLLAGITAIFILSWSPLTIFTLLIEFHPDTLVSSNDWVRHAFLICYLVAMVPTGANPILYGYLNTNLRKSKRKNQKTDTIVLL